MEGNVSMRSNLMDCALEIKRGVSTDGGDEDAAVQSSGGSRTEREAALCQLGAWRAHESWTSDI